MLKYTDVYKRQQYIQSRLEAPEMYEGYSYTDDSGELIEFEATKNPRYLEGAQREAYEFVHKLLPGDQQVQIGQMTTQKPGELMIYSAGMTAVSYTHLDVYKRQIINGFIRCTSRCSMKRDTTP